LPVGVRDTPFSAGRGEVTEGGFLERVAAALGLREPAKDYVIKNHHGVSIGIDDWGGNPRRVHAFTHNKRERSDVNRRLVVVAKAIAGADVLGRFRQLRPRLVTPATPDGVMYVGWEWTKTDTDSQEAAMALQLVQALSQAWDRT
jgi:hypothetical protein